LYIAYAAFGRQTQHTINVVSNSKILFNNSFKMVSKKKIGLLMLSFMIFTIVIINVGTNILSSSKNKTQNEFFRNIDLKLKGIVCSVEKQTDTYKFIVTLRDIESNYNEYKKNSPLRAFFCIHNKDIAVFSDHNDYSIGDTIYLGENKIDLINFFFLTVI